MKLFPCQTIRLLILLIKGSLYWRGRLFGIENRGIGNAYLFNSLPIDNNAAHVLVFDEF